MINKNVDREAQEQGREQSPPTPPPPPFDKEYAHALRRQLLTITSLGMTRKFSETLSALVEAAAITIAGVASTDRVMRGDEAGLATIEQALASIRVSVEKGYEVGNKMPIPQDILDGLTQRERPTLIAALTKPAPVTT